MKVIFLDFDGVLNSWAFARRTGAKGLLGLDPEAVTHLNAIVERTGADVVVSSSWRLIHKRAKLRGRLAEVGFKGRLRDVTPNLRTTLIDRSDEIRAWLDHHNVRASAGFGEAVSTFVILDDGGDADIPGHFVRTTFEEGLTAEHVEAAVAILGEP